MFIQQLLNGISIGFIYILIAVGLTMVYGVLKILHFAHGVIYTIGAFSAMVGMIYLHLPYIWAFLFAIAISASVGVLIERFAYRPLRGVHPITVLISGIGVAIILENIFQVLFTSDTRPFPETGIEFKVKLIALHGVRVHCQVGHWYLNGGCITSFNMAISIYRCYPVSISPGYQIIGISVLIHVASV